MTIRALAAVTLVALLLIPALLPTHPARAQAEGAGALDGPITALAEGARGQLVVGQGETVLDVMTDGPRLTVRRSRLLAQGVIRAIVPYGPNWLVLTERSLVTFDGAAWAVIGTLPGGGQRVVAAPPMIYVAALDAGVRVLSFADGRLRLIARIQTGGPAEDIALGEAGSIWVAERSTGIRLYDLTDPLRPAIRFWTRDLQPATRVYATGARLAVGFGNQVGLLDISTLSAPRLSAQATAGGPFAQISALAVAGDLLAVGLSSQAGPDALLFNTAGLTTLQLSQKRGVDGAGDQLAFLSGDAPGALPAIITGSARFGLRRWALDSGTTAPLAEYPVDAARLACPDIAPSSPQPANLSAFRLAPGTPQLVLRWGAACPVRRYIVLINGAEHGQADVASYTLNNPPDVFTWQVIAVDGTQRAAGPVWTMEIERDGLLSNPLAIRSENILYRAPLGVFFETPAGVLLLSVGAVLMGLGIVIGVAYWLGARAQNALR